MSNARSASLPNFLIIGVAKAGTTALASYLGSHPQVFVAREKEVHFFDDNFHKGLDWYRSRFDEVRSELAVGDATPTYIYVDKAIERMAAVLPDAKLIVVLRNPIDRAYSHYWWMRPLSEQLSFEDAVRAELAAGDQSQERVYISGGHYLERLKRVCEYYPRSSLHVLISEELKASPGPTYEEVCRFLGVDDGVKPENLGTVLNSAYLLRHPWLRPLLFRVRAFKWMPFDLAGRIDQWNRVPFQYPPIDPRLREELDTYYHEHNATLAAWLGRDLSLWGPRAAGPIPQGDVV
jgi:hypothetical protein